MALAERASPLAGVRTRLFSLRQGGGGVYAKFAVPDLWVRTGLDAFRAGESEASRQVWTHQ